MLPTAQVEKFFSRQHLVRTTILALALVLVVVGAITVFSSLSPKSIARKYCIAESDDDIATMAKYLVYDYKEYLMRDYRNEESFYKTMSDELGEDIASWNDYCKVSLKMRKDDREDAFGKYKITAEVTREKNLSKNKLKTEMGDYVLKELKKRDFDADTVTEGKMCTVKWKLTGEDDSYKITYTVYLGKVNGAWKVLYGDQD